MGHEVLPWRVTIRFLWLRLEPPKVVESGRPVVPKRKTGAATLPPAKSTVPSRPLDQLGWSRLSRRFPQAFVAKQRSASCNQKAGAEKLQCFVVAQTPANTGLWPHVTGLLGVSRQAQIGLRRAFKLAAVR
jgi:hypothetical protein